MLILPAGNHGLGLNHMKPAGDNLQHHNTLGLPIFHQKINAKILSQKHAHSRDRQAVGHRGNPSYVANP